VLLIVLGSCFTNAHRLGEPKRSFLKITWLCTIFHLSFGFDRLFGIWLLGFGIYCRTRGSVHGRK
jgi:hypothetical protein